MHEEPLPRGRPVIFGEVLFDCFEDDGTDVLGGAPFNVAWHLQGFGLSPLFISRIGDDERGRQVQRAMREWGLDSAGLQVDPRHPTGEVRIRLDAGQPTFNILPEQAYDFIDAGPALATLCEPPALLYHGSLAARHNVSAATLSTLRAQLQAPVFVDVNLRAPWWDRPSLAEHLQGARWVKLNDSEVAEVSGGSPLDDTALLEAADALRLENRIDALIVTLGERGAIVLDRKGVWRDRPPPLTDIADTVGAGDAFSAVAIIGLLRGWDPPQILERAMAFAGAICQVRGATVADTDFYRAQQKNWD